MPIDSAKIMINVGLIKELYFISKVLKTEIEAEFRYCGAVDTVEVKIKDDIMHVSYWGRKIWRENLKEGDSMFGIESCYQINKIMKLIDLGDDTIWRGETYFEDV